MSGQDSRHDLSRHPTPNVFDSFDGWAQLLRHDGDGDDVAAGQPAAVPHRPGDAEAAPLRPVIRRAMALVHVVDDGLESGETVRMRGDSLVIGRSEGDIIIPHDVSMSTRHAVIERLPEGGWQLSDLGSAGGTFVRVTKTRLKNGSVIQVGATRLRFETAAGHPLDTPDAADTRFVEVLPHGTGRWHTFPGPAAAIGRADADCELAIDDAFVSPRHATVRHTPRGWFVENTGANGLWVRIEAPLRLAAASQFLCGEQRFVFVPLVT
ncbi:MAG: FHA domain-containing protein [Planctomycetia bacterium]|nr:FHA domain-containing protein [Planctomycetia bacterium]